MLELCLAECRTSLLQRGYGVAGVAGAGDGAVDIRATDRDRGIFVRALIGELRACGICRMKNGENRADEQRAGAHGKTPSEPS